MREIVTTAITDDGRNATVMGCVISANKASNVDEENKGGDVVMWVVEEKACSLIRPTSVS